MTARGIEVRPCADAADEERSLAIYNAVEPPAVDPPPGVLITTWAERPELARAMRGPIAEVEARA